LEGASVLQSLVSLPRTPGVRSPELLALDAQAGLLPYALAAFAVGMSLLGWTAAQATNAPWLAVSLAQFALNWAMFYVVFSWLKRDPVHCEDIGSRARLHVMGGLLWAVAMGQLAVIALGAGPAREALLVLSLAGAITCFFFTAPHRLSLLIVGPVAALPALVLLNLQPHADRLAELAQGATALAFALAFLANHMLRQHFIIAAEREFLTEARAQALARAESLAKTKSNLLATLSHEVRTGLSGVVHVLAAAAGAGSRSRPSREQLTAALEAARDLVSVLDATLDSETAEQGKLRLAVQTFAPAQLAREAILLAQPLAAAKGLELTVETHLGEGGAVVADPIRTRQILANLIGNAVKYTLRGRVALKVFQTGDRVRFEVVDTGPGLTPEALQLAFEPFQRIEATCAGVPGAGLGLSLSRRLAKLMGGEVTGESAPGVGSRFWLELPFDPALSPDAALPSSGGRALRVLAAEPDSLHAALLRAALEQLGHGMLHAQDGARALDLLKLGEVDVVLVGGSGAGLAGPDAIRAIRTLESSAARAPIVAVIGGEIEEARACLQAGADAVLRKPVTVASLARAITAALDPAARAEAEAA
jgi:signal transduction histidine kinase/ActR/RegA family two-component response regulator